MTVFETLQNDVVNYRFSFSSSSFGLEIKLLTLYHIIGQGERASRSFTKETRRRNGKEAKEKEAEI